MQTLKINYLLMISVTVFLMSRYGYTCPITPPVGFQEFKNEKGFKLFSNPKKTAVIGLKCQNIDKQEAYKSLQYFSDRTILDETTSYYSFNPEGSSNSRIYFKVKDKELIQVSVLTSYTTSSQSSSTNSSASKVSQKNENKTENTEDDSMNALQKTIIEFMNQP